MDLTVVANTALNKLDRRLPEILIGSGITGAIAAAVWACKKTLELPEVTAESKKEIEKTKDIYADVIEEGKAHKEYKAYQKEIGKEYLKFGGKAVVLYAGPVILGTLSIGMIIASNSIQRKRYLEVSTVLAVTEQAYKNYRKAVIDKFGEEVDKDIRLGVHKEKIEVEDENGKKSKEAVEVTDFNDNCTLAEYSPYAKFFDESCAEWTKSADYNLTLLLARQTEANRRLRAQGHLFLNEVYDMLGIPRTTAGQIVGWIYDEDHPIGDNCVDFGLHDVRRQSSRNFVNGWERVILLDFNVDGNIVDKI